MIKLLDNEIFTKLSITGKILCLGLYSHSPCPQGIPTDKNLGSKSGECGDNSESHFRLISRSKNRCHSHANDLFEAWDVPLSCWNHWRALPTECCPELPKHLDIPLGVNCRKPLVVVLEPEWPNDTMLGYGDPGCALHGVQLPLGHNSGDVPS